MAISHDSRRLPPRRLEHLLARGQDHPGRILWGHRLFVVTFVLLGIMSVIAALAHARGLASLGLIAGFLLVGMLCDIKH